MIGEKARGFFSEKLFLPIGKKLSFLSPNFITTLAYPLAIIACYFIYIKDYPIALAFVLFSSFIDNLDGSVAKANNKKTAFGSYYDAFTDRMQEFIILLGFALSGYPIEAFCALWACFLISFAKARAEMIKPLGNIDWPSIGERAERLIIIMLTLFVAIFKPEINGYNTISIGLGILTGIVMIGIVQRFFFAKAYLSKK